MKRYKNHLKTPKVWQALPILRIFLKIDRYRVHNYLLSTYALVFDKQVSSADRILVPIVYGDATRYRLRQVSQAYLVSEPDPADRRPASFFRFLLLRYTRVPCQRRRGISEKQRQKRKEKIGSAIEEWGREAEVNAFRLASGIKVPSAAFMQHRKV